MLSGRCPGEKEARPSFLAANVGPSQMRAIISLRDFRGLGVKMIPLVSSLFPRAQNKIAQYSVQQTFRGWPKN
jgi:hypothetical protein